MMRLVSRYDPGAEFEVEFFGGRLKLFIDWQQGNSSADEEKESYEGKSYVIRRGGKGKTLGGGATRRVAALVAEYKIESYLSGGMFSLFLFLPRLSLGPFMCKKLTAILQTFLSLCSPKLRETYWSLTGTTTSRENIAPLVIHGRMKAARSPGVLPRSDHCHISSL
jgi:hypothetical protein